MEVFLTPHTQYCKFGKFQQTKLKNTSSRVNLEYPIYPYKQEVTTSKFSLVEGVNENNLSIVI